MVKMTQPRGLDQGCGPIQSSTNGTRNDHCRRPSGRAETGPNRLVTPRRAPLTTDVLLSALFFVLWALLTASVSTPPAWSAPQGAGPSSSPSVELTERRAEVSALKTEVSALDDQISALVEQYDQAGYFLSVAKKNEQQATLKVAAAKRSLAEAKSRFQDRVRQTYKQSPLTVLDLLLSSRSMSELVSRLRYVTGILEGDSRTIGEVAQKKSELEERQHALEAERTRRETITRGIAQKRDQIEAKLTERQQDLDAARSDVARLADQQRRADLAHRASARVVSATSRGEAQEVTDANAASGTTRTTHAAATPATTKQSTTAAATRTATTAQHRTTTTTHRKTTTTAKPAPKAVKDPAPSDLGGRIVDIGMRYLGVPYVWGGASTKGFDCSGLTMYVLGKVGVDLPHSSGLQFQTGTPVGRDRLRPGDLVFFGSPVHHVGIYVGSGEYLHAPYTGEVVQVSALNRADYAGARRF